MRWGREGCRIRAANAKRAWLARQSKRGGGITLIKGCGCDNGEISLYRPPTNFAQYGGYKGARRLG